MKLKSKLLPLLLSLTVIFSFSVMGTSTNLAAANSKEPLKVPKRSSHTSTYDPKDGNLVIITAGTTANLPEGKNAQVFYPDSSSGPLTTRLKIKPKHSGYILFTCKASNKIKLCDSKGHDMSSWRKVYGNSEIYNLRKVAFGVKGGQSYYLKVFGTGIKFFGHRYDVVSYINGKVTGKFGKSANTAVKIKRDAYHHGFLQSTSKPKYYTFNKRASKIECFIDHLTDDSLKATITITAKGMKKYRKVVNLKRQNVYGSKERDFVYKVPGKKRRNMKVIIKMNHSKKSSGIFRLSYM